MKNDDLGDRMKYYESFESERRLCVLLPVLSRLDGVCFHKFTRNLKRPYDERLSSLMMDVTQYLMEYFGADVGYTQSDEISLVWKNDDYRVEMHCGGRIQKLNSHLASKCSVRFNKLLTKYLPEKVGEEPTFDCRIFSVPNLTEATNQLLFREQDASKNSISMAARAYFSHNELMDKSGPEMQEMLFQVHKVNWNDYPSFFRRGTFITKRVISTPFTPEELDTLPEKHNARKDPNLTFERTKYIRCNLPKLSTIVNREKFLFFGEEPITGQNNV